MGKKSFVIALAVFAFGFGSALRSNAGTDMIEPYRAPAPTYNYAATAAAPCRIMSSASSLRRRHRSSVWWLLRSAIWLLRWPPVLRPPRLLGRASPSLALTNICVEAAVSAATQVKAMVPVLTTRLLRFRFDFRKSRLLQLLIQRGKIGLQ